MSDTDAPDPPPLRNWLITEGLPRDWLRQGADLLEREAGNDPGGIALIMV
ncbi:MAG: hypothetical protein ACRDQZ_20070 [Mycobacteriales bacterium]